MTVGELIDGIRALRSKWRLFVPLGLGVMVFMEGRTAFGIAGLVFLVLLATLGSALAYLTDEERPA